MARTGPINMHTSNFEDAAEYISKHVREKGRTLAAAVVTPEGTLRLMRPGIEADYERISKQPNFIGIYSPTTRIENIENDILDWLRSENNHLRA